MNEAKELFYQDQILSEIGKLGNIMNSILSNILNEITEKVPSEIFQYLEYTNREVRDYFELLLFLFQKKNKKYYLLNEASCFVRASFEAMLKLAFIIKDSNYGEYYFVCKKNVTNYESMLNNYSEIQSNDSQHKVIGLKPSLMIKLTGRELNHRKSHLDEMKKFRNENHKNTNNFEKCKILGSVWEYLYTSIYKYLSTTIHGDTHRIKSKKFYEGDFRTRLIYKYKAIEVFTLMTSAMENLIEDLCKTFDLENFLKQYYLAKESYSKNIDQYISHSEVNMQRGA